MKSREFLYVGEPAPQITEEEYTAFYLHFQKSILASLEKRELLTPSQYRRCVEEIEKQCRNSLRKGDEYAGTTI